MKNASSSQRRFSTLETGETCATVVGTFNSQKHSLGKREEEKEAVGGQVGASRRVAQQQEPPADSILGSEESTEADENRNKAVALVINHSCEMELIVESEEKVDAEISSFSALPKLLCFTRCSVIIIFLSLNIIGRVALGKGINRVVVENLTRSEL
ncbi:hypothetical protein Baya_5449 [Bagarius yarrelli]|uniref:Uncharacterized protein n=1 Tax=Bagarius yarrelli TaxID=175774 RepID=A0A556TUW4_BAGYA|nr:hypothetical protein Baya_5449 [Bagarius yarrelli]